MFCGSHPLGLVIERSSSGMLGLMSGRWLQSKPRHRTSSAGTVGPVLLFLLRTRRLGTRAGTQESLKIPLQFPPLPVTSEGFMV